ncbi:MAG: insulinase family protein [Chloracidobacterium sp.]|nr:insulinase family protein [Chloracidobacterium sp.]
MRRTFFSALLIVAVSANAVFAQKGKPKPVKPAVNATQQLAAEVPIVTKTLANGLEVIVLPDPSLPLITVELDVRNGSFTEPPEFNGLSHLFEHMFFRTNEAVILAQCERGMAGPRCGDIASMQRKIGNTDYLNRFYELGIAYNGSTREEVVNYFVRTTSTYLEEAFRYINDSARFPVFDEAEFEREKLVVLGEIDRNEANPFFDLNSAFQDKLFYKYPSRKRPGGTRETVASATTAKMRLIQSRYYVPNNSALIVTGDAKPDQVFAMAEKVFGSWERRAVDPFKEFPLVEHPPLPRSEGLIIDQRTDAESGDDVILIMLGWHGPSIGKDNAATYAADVFSYILGQPDSRFQRDLVDSGLVLGVGVNYYTQRNVGPISVVIQTTPDKAKAALKAVYSEIAQFSSPTYYSNAELDASKTILASSDLFDREKLSEYAHTLGFWWSTTGVDYFRGYQKNLNAVTRADIDRYVRNYILDKPHVGIAMVPPAVKTQANLTEQDLIGTAK